MLRATHVFDSFEHADVSHVVHSLLVFLSHTHVDIKVHGELFSQVFSHRSSARFNPPKNFVRQNVSHSMVHSLTILRYLIFPFKGPFAVVGFSGEFKGV